MLCPKCNGKTHVVETFGDVEETHRLRECVSCKHKILTVEEEVPMHLLTEIRRFKEKRIQLQKERNNETVR
jgi:transcriptional regulator NrdR family protein